MNHESRPCQESMYTVSTQGHEDLPDSYTTLPHGSDALRWRTRTAMGSKQYTTSKLAASVAARPAGVPPPPHAAFSSTAGRPRQRASSVCSSSACRDGRCSQAQVLTACASALPSGQVQRERDGARQRGRASKGGRDMPCMGMHAPQACSRTGPTRWPHCDGPFAGDRRPFPAHRATAAYGHSLRIPR